VLLSEVGCVPLVTSYDRAAVVGSDGRVLGRVAAVLFHASEPRVVGVQIDPGPLFGLIGRRPRFALLASLEHLDGDTLRFTGKKLPSNHAAEAALGFGWDESVVWRGMSARSAEGDRIGIVSDVQFDAATGAIAAIHLSTGVVGDLALGRLEVAGALVRGFDGTAVVVLPGYNDIRAGGGVAKVVATGMANVKVRGEQVAEGALQVGVAAARAAGRSLRSGMGRTVLDKVRSLTEDDD
jgi:hypothetical protein